MFYIGYEDKGPSGVCGQTVSNTAPWRKLFIFHTEEKARKFINNLQSYGRSQPKIIGFWSDEKENYYDEVIVDE